MDWGLLDFAFDIILFMVNIFRKMVTFAWLLTILFSSPQAIIFRVLKHPTKDFYQCTTINYFEDLSNEVVVVSDSGTNMTELQLLGLNSCLSFK